MPPEAQASVIVRQSADGGVATVIVPPSGVDLEAVERALIVFALESAAGNRTRAAKLLRLTRKRAALSDAGIQFVRRARFF
jgi:DNA-binding NtrC family response regulator